MPLYKYCCDKCEVEFEFQHDFDDQPRCPKCNTRDVRKVEPEMGPGKPCCERPDGGSCCEEKKPKQGG